MSLHKNPNTHTRNTCDLLLHKASTGDARMCGMSRIQVRADDRGKQKEAGDSGRKESCGMCALYPDADSISGGKLRSIKTVAKQLNVMEGKKKKGRT